MKDRRFVERLNGLSKDITVGIVGMGAMGKGLLYQTEITPGMRTLAVADLDVQKAIDCAREIGRSYRVAESPGELADAASVGELAICKDGTLVAAADGIDVFCEASSAIQAGGLFSVAALETGKHLILMNAEVDLAFGPALMEIAEKHNVVYASCDGDQHGVIKYLIDDLELWGFELVMAGNMKGFLDRYSNPTKIVPEADKRNLDYRMATAYTDGTKLCVEMALVANAYGLRTDCPGMHGPRVDQVRNAVDYFDLDSIRVGGAAVVDYVLGCQPDGGVFAIGYCDNPYQQSMLHYYKMGAGPYYVFYRPYHLCHVEAMACMAEAYLDGTTLLAPHKGYKTDVIAYAKKDLTAGDKLDGIGGYACYGLIENCARAEEPAGLSICFAENVELVRDIKKDERIQLDDITWDPHRSDFKLRGLAKSSAMV